MNKYLSEYRSLLLGALVKCLPCLRAKTAVGVMEMKVIIKVLVKSYDMLIALNLKKDWNWAPQLLTHSFYTMSSPLSVWCSEKDPCATWSNLLQFYILFFLSCWSWILWRNVSRIFKLNPLRSSSCSTASKGRWLAMSSALGLEMYLVMVSRGSVFIRWRITLQSSEEYGAW